jgi:hypothetical protein
LEHFDRILTQRELQSVMVREKTRLAAPFEPCEKAAPKRRRKAVIQILGQALFVDRKHGAAVASRVLASLPMPHSTRFSTGRTKR